MNAQETYDLYQKGTNFWNTWAVNITNQELTQERMNEVAKTDFSLVAENYMVINLDGFIFPAESLVIENPISEEFSFIETKIQKITISNFRQSNFKFNRSKTYCEIKLKTKIVKEINIEFMKCSSIDFEDCEINKFIIKDVKTKLNFNKCPIKGKFDFIGIDSLKSIKFIGCIIEKNLVFL